MPPDERREARRLYRERVGIVGFGIGTVALLAGAVLLAPHLVALRVLLAGARADHARTSAVLVSLGPLAAEASALEGRLGRLGDLDASAVTPTALLDFITAHRPAGVRVSRLSFDGARVTIGGTASSRGALRKFLDTLASDKRVSALDAPISNFIAGKDLVFTASFVFALAP